MADYSKLVQFYTGSERPTTNVNANGLYFISKTVDGQHVGELWRGATLIAQTNDVNAISQLQDAINTINGTLATKANQSDLDEHLQAAASMAGAISTIQGVLESIRDAGEGGIDSFADVQAALNDAANARAQVLADAKAYADGKDAAIKEAKDAADAAQSTAEDAAGSAAQANAAVGALNTRVGELPADTDATSVVDYIEKKTSKIASSEQMAQLGEKVATAEGKITTLEGKVDVEKVSTAISSAVAEEAARATSAEGGLSNRIKAIEDDYLKKADKEELQGNINTVSQTLAGVKKDVDDFFKDALVDEEDVTKVKNTLREIQDYINSDVEGAAGMASSIQTNKEAIESNDADILALQQKDTAIEEDIEALEKELTTPETGLKARMKSAEDEIEALKEAVGGEGSVADAIEAAVSPVRTQANENKTAIAGLTTEVGKKASQDDLGALTTRVSSIETDLNTAETGLKAQVAANKAATEANAAAIEAETTRATGVENTLIAALSWQEIPTV